MQEINIASLFAGLLSDNTLESYGYAWKLYLAFAGNHDAALEAGTLLQWRQHLVGTGVTANTINTRIAAIKATARELYNHRLITRDTYYDFKEIRKLPSLALKERRRPNNRVRIEPEQMRKLVKAPKVDIDKPVELRDRALMMVMATTGARISEIVRMKVKDIVALPGNKFVITGVVGKRNAEPRSVPLSPEAYSTILDWLEFRPVASPYIFSSFRYDPKADDILYSDHPISRHLARHRIKRYGAEIGMPEIKAHDFRRFVGTQLAKKDIRLAQRVLGHASIATTANNYVLDEFEVGATDSLF